MNIASSGWRYTGAMKAVLGAEVLQAPSTTVAGIPTIVRKKERRETSVEGLHAVMRP